MSSPIAQMRPRRTRTCALLAAAGAGRRLLSQGLPEPAARSKAFFPLRGKPLFLYSLEALRQCPEISDIVIIVPAPLLEETRRLLAANPPKEDKNEIVVAGGETRQQSVYNGLRAAPADTNYVLIHDAARPFITPELVKSCLSCLRQIRRGEPAAREHQAATIAVPATETVKSSADGEWVEATLDRSRLWLIQTPQAFTFPLILEAHKKAAAEGLEASDDAALVEMTGHPVRLVPGAKDNLKITYPEDLLLAEAIVARSEAPLECGGLLPLSQRGLAPAAQNQEWSNVIPPLRVGLGFDVHAFAEGRKLVLAGLEFPGPGLAGHSDADLICHAAADAALGAAGLGDIGLHFPDTDPRFKDASSIGLLERVGEMLAEAGLRVAWLDIVLAAEEPKVSPHAAAMKENLARALQTAPACVSIKGKTTEGLGFIGRREGLACWALCLVAGKPAAEKEMI